MSSYEQSLLSFSRSLGDDWYAYDDPTRGLTWRVFVNREVLVPDQGWKLHVSASAFEAWMAVDTVLPILAAAGAHFKLPADLEGVVAINSGAAGATQLGKVVTVYPPSAEVLATIVDSLRRVWSESSGPAVPTDLAVCGTSSLFVRYGSFRNATVRTDSIGRFTSMLVTATGTVEEEVRSLDGAQPEWASPPPISCRAQNPRVPLDATIAERYVPILSLQSTPRGDVVLAIDAKGKANVVVKTAIAGVAGDTKGTDARARLENERDILSRIPAGIGPRLVDFVSGQVAAIVTESLDSIDLLEQPVDVRLRSIRDLASCLTRLHRAGWVHRDLKLGNVACDGEGCARLIDFELAARAGEVPTARGGTQGHMAPEVVEGEDVVADPASDVFALGAMIGHALLEWDPATLPPNAGRLVGLLRLRGRRDAARAVARLVARDPSARSSGAGLDACVSSIPSVESPPSTRLAFPHQWARRAAASAGRAARHFKVDGAAPCPWRNRHFQADYECEAINLGAAGIVLGLAAIDDAVGRRDFSADITEGASWLASRDPSGSAPGLFTGNAGVALALGVAGLREGNACFVQQARARLSEACRAVTEPDLFTGAAGVIFAAVELGRMLGDGETVRAVAPLVDDVRARCEVVGGAYLWRQEGALEGSETRFIGAAHGTAGIGLALARFAQATDDSATLNFAVDALASVFSSARTTDGSTLVRSWDDRERASLGDWCHGTLGYLWCLLQAGFEPRLAPALEWAFDVAHLAYPSSNSTYCHGVSGHVETMRMARSLGGARGRLADQAMIRGVLTLRALSRRGDDGSIVWSSEDPDVVTPDLWVGFLGPATALALADSGSTQSVLQVGSFPRHAL